MSGERRFDEREVAEILRRATEPRRDAAVARASAGSGLTLGEVKEIAAEAGIDLARIEEAADAIAHPPRPTRLDAFVGTPTNIRYQFEVPGRLEPGAHDEIVRLIRATLDARGVVGGHDGGLEWMSRDAFGSTNVAIVPTATGTRVEVTGRFDVAAAGAAGVTGVTGVVGAAGTALLVASSGPVGWVLAPATLAAMYAIPRATLGSRVRRETRSLARLADRIRELLAIRSEPRSR